MGGARQIGHYGAKAAGQAYDAYDNTVRTGQEFKDMGNDVVQSVIDTGIDSDESTSAYKYAQKLQGKQNKGKDLSDWNVGRQYQKNVKAIDNENMLLDSLARNTGIKNEIHDKLTHNTGQELNGRFSQGDDVNIEEQNKKGSEPEDKAKNALLFDTASLPNNIISPNNQNANTSRPKFVPRGKVDISANADTSIPQTAGHEYTHAFKVNAPETYKAFETYVLQSAEATNSKALHDRINELQNKYGYSEEVAREEVAAETAEKFLGDKGSIDKIAYGNPTLADKILNGIKTAKVQIQSALSSPYTNDRTGVQMTYAQLNEAEKIWNNALYEATRNKDTVAGSGEVRNSIAEIKGNNGNYGAGVYLDTNLFDGVKPRNWGKVLSKYVYENLAGTDLTVYDDAGNPEVISFAKKNERVTKDNATNSHKVIDKLARARGNANSLGIVHIDELLKTATNNGNKTTSNHQWLDQNGWEYKKAYMQDVNGRIYETTLNIAKTADGRNVLYALSNTKQIDEGVVPSAHNKERGSHTNRLSVDNNISQNNSIVNSAEESMGDIGKIERVPFPAFSGSKTSDNVTSAKRNSFTDSISDNSENVKYSMKESADNTMHTPEQLKIMQEYEDAVDDDLLAFVERAKENPKDNKSVFVLGDVSDRMVGDIKTLTGIDTSDFGNVVKNNSITHIL